MSSPMLLPASKTLWPCSTVACRPSGRKVTVWGPGGGSGSQSRSSTIFLRGGSVGASAMRILIHSALQLHDLVAQLRGTLELQAPGGRTHLVLQVLDQPGQLVFGQVELHAVGHLLLGHRLDAVCQVADALDNAHRNDVVLFVEGDLLLAPAIGLVDGL